MIKPSEVIRYSEAFKQQVVSELESGKFKTSSAAARAYSIKGHPTVNRWLRQYGRTDLIPKRITISTMKEQDETKALKERVRKLEKALSDAHMKGLLEESYLEIACERIGVDVSEFKKKHVTKLSNGPDPKQR
jgi:transposase-like protein